MRTFVERRAAIHSAPRAIGKLGTSAADTRYAMYALGRRGDMTAVPAGAGPLELRAPWNWTERLGWPPNYAPTTFLWAALTQYTHLAWPGAFVCLYRRIRTANANGCSCCAPRPLSLLPAAAVVTAVATVTATATATAAATVAAATPGPERRPGRSRIAGLGGCSYYSNTYARRIANPRPSTLECLFGPPNIPQAATGLVRQTHFPFQRSPTGSLCHCYTS